MPQLTEQQLNTLNALVEYGSVTRAADALGKSMPTVSHRLKQLRRITGRMLFTRTFTGLIPEDYTLELLKRQEMLPPLNALRRSFILSTYTPLELILSRTLQEMPDTTPGYSVRFKPMAETDEMRIRRLRARDIDFDIGSQLSRDSSIISTPYFSTPMSVLISASHPTIGDTLTPEDWYSNRHLHWLRDHCLEVSSGDGSPWSSTLLDARNIGPGSTNLLALACQCSQGADLLLIPQMFVASLCALFPLRSCSLPAPLSINFHCYIHYHRALQQMVESAVMADFFKTASKVRTPSEMG